MNIDKKILNEISRYHFINNYIKEQADPLALGDDAGAPPPPAPEAGAPPAPETGAAPAPETPAQPIDVENDPDVEKIDDGGESEEKGSEGEGTEELEITDLVKSQEKIETKQEEYFNNLFSQVSSLEAKLGEMDTILNKLNSLEAKIEKYREKTPQEKLDLRKYDSYPFNQKLSDFFEDKKDEMEKTGKLDYVLTSDEVTDVNDKQMKDSFLPSATSEIGY
jgi:molecular chaperone GrpE (heat shock protein)